MFIEFIEIYLFHILKSLLLNCEFMQRAEVTCWFIMSNRYASFFTLNQLYLYWKVMQHKKQYFYSKHAALIWENVPKPCLCTFSVSSLLLSKLHHRHSTNFLLVMKVICLHKLWHRFLLKKIINLITLPCLDFEITWFTWGQYFFTCMRKGHENMCTQVSYHFLCIGKSMKISSLSIRTIFDHTDVIVGV